MYAFHVGELDWANLYARAGTAISLAVRRFAADYQWCLIDARAGRSAVASICTTVLPSVLVPVFSANSQSIDGAAAAIRRAVDERNRIDQGPLTILPLLSRVDPSLPSEALERSRVTFETQFQEAYQLEKCDLRPYFNKVWVPYDPGESFGETISVMGAPPSGSLLVTAYERFCERLVRLDDPWESSQKVFVSYCHTDRDAKDSLVEQLLILQREGIIEHVWDDSRIKPGAEWEKEIDDAMADANVAIFLVSAPFLNSDFIRTKEVPSLLEHRRRSGVRIIPVLVDHCPWQAVDWLRRLHIVTNDGQPIRGAATRKRLFAKLAADI